jgi:regulatory protein
MSDFEKAREKALKLLKIRPHSSAELCRKLVLRGFNETEAKSVAQALQEEGLINDAEFAQLFLDSLIRFKNFGYYGLLAKLRQRGIEKSMAEQLLREFLPIEEELQIAQKVVSKERQPDKMKLAQKLSRKGFRSEVINQAISEI